MVGGDREDRGRGEGCRRAGQGSGTGSTGQAEGLGQRMGAASSVQGRGGTSVPDCHGNLKREAARAGDWRDNYHERAGHHGRGQLALLCHSQPGHSSRSGSQSDAPATSKRCMICRVFKGPGQDTGLTICHSLVRTQ